MGARRKKNIIKTAYAGTNADLLPKIFNIYVKKGCTIADVTYGKGVFWRKIDENDYKLLKSDIKSGVDFRNLPYNDDSIDVLILDPPYMHGGGSIKLAMNKNYRVGSIPRGRKNLIRLYAHGIIEASRVLKKNGIILVKCQDEIDSHKQCLNHLELCQLLTLFGYEILDVFVLVQTSTPIMHYKIQEHARKNHSYLIVSNFKDK